MVQELRRVLARCVAALLVVAASLVAVGSPGLAACQRVIVINPEVTVSEGAGRLIFTVFSGGCAASGQVAYAVTAGGAQPGVDFALSAGQLRWAAGDSTTRRITVTVALDSVPEPALEDFRVTLVNPSPGVRVAHGVGYGRILDDDGLGFAWAVDDQICPQWVVDQTPPPGEPWIVGEQRRLCDLVEGAIYLVPPPGPVMTARWETADGTAQAGVDFVGVTDRVVAVPAGATLVALPVKLLSRPEAPQRRWFYVRAFAPSHGTVVDGVAVVTLLGS
ncbi:Calx-beta domain-containing protein [Micromonospora cathayae]|uniref:Calx-beta domain-containing protein n=1 Tax=Micromonospora cathayae TaxID=3028804 RepID=A0ABY7ZYS9_9ACTN|nr:Calx-beta domain-containing protein [Micromonospora sp. HUAS 3]WDZ87252.1 Calx-beta domain-containing protein [Micromonospora sp. HUAS 3]